MAKALKLGMKKNFKLSASIICGDLLKIGEEVKLLEKGGIDSIHFDAMDGNFVPRFGFPPEVVKSIKSVSKLPVSVHMMISNPISYAKIFSEAGADSLVVHVESAKNVSGLVEALKRLNVRVGLALKPETPINKLDDVLGQIDIILLMAIQPGILGQKFNEQTYNKVLLLKQKIEKYPNIDIEVDGGINVETGSKLVHLGVNILDCGTSSIYKENKDLDTVVREFRQSIEKQLKLQI